MTLAMSRCEAAAGTRYGASRVAANQAAAIAKVTCGRFAAGSGSVTGLERCTRHRPSPGSSPALTRKPMKSLEYFSDRLLDGQAWMITRSTILIALLLLASCSPFSTQHEILGANSYGYGVDNVEIVEDIEIDELRLRQVRVPSEVCLRGYQDHLELDGPIGPTTTEYLDKLLSRLDKCLTGDGRTFSKVVYLNSMGGKLIDAFKIGQILRYHQVQTILVGGQRCASACAIAFLGGVHRTIIDDGQLVFHLPYLKTESGIDCTDQGQVTALKSYFDETLDPAASQVVFEQSKRYCSETKGWTINADLARQYNIVTE